MAPLLGAADASVGRCGLGNSVSLSTGLDYEPLWHDHEKPLSQQFLAHVSSPIFPFLHVDLISLCTNLLQHLVSFTPQGNISTYHRKVSYSRVFPILLFAATWKQRHLFSFTYCLYTLRTALCPPRLHHHLQQ